MKASQAEQRADRVESQLATAKKNAEEADQRLEKALRDVQAARAEVRKEAERADALEDQVSLSVIRSFSLYLCLALLLFFGSDLFFFSVVLLSLVLSFYCSLDILISCSLVFVFSFSSPSLLSLSRSRFLCSTRS